MEKTLETLYTPTDREKDALSNLDQDDVIAVGPWAKGEGSMPHRAVIRDLGDKFVVHTQIVGESNAFYEQGNYVPKLDGYNALEVAIASFNDRIRRHHNLLIFTRQ